MGAWLLYCVHRALSGLEQQGSIGPCCNADTATVPSVQCGQVCGRECSLQVRVHTERKYERENLELTSSRKGGWQCGCVTRPQRALSGCAPWMSATDKPTKRGCGDQCLLR